MMSLLVLWLKSFSGGCTTVSISHLQSHAGTKTYAGTLDTHLASETNRGTWKTQKEPFGAWPSPVDQEKLAHLVAHCNTHKASRSWLFMPLNLALKIKLLSCAVIVELVGIIYANVKVSLWILIVTDRENYSSQVEKMQEDWLGVTLKRKSPPTAGLSYYTDHIKHLKNCVYCVRRCRSLFHSLVWETGSYLKLESASLLIDSSSFRHVSPRDITERGRAFSDKRLDFSCIWLII